MKIVQWTNWFRNIPFVIFCIEICVFLFLTWKWQKEKAVSKNANYNKTPLLSKPEGFRCQWCFHYV